jgi:hypothetical protein
MMPAAMRDAERGEQIVRSSILLFGLSTSKTISE